MDFEKTAEGWIGAALAAFGARMTELDAGWIAIAGLFGFGVVVKLSCVISRRNRRKAARKMTWLDCIQVRSFLNKDDALVDALRKMQNIASLRSAVRSGTVVAPYEIDGAGEALARAREFDLPASGPAQLAAAVGNLSRWAESFNDGKFPADHPQDVAAGLIARKAAIERALDVCEREYRPAP